MERMRQLVQLLHGGRLLPLLEAPDLVHVEAEIPAPQAQRFPATAETFGESWIHAGARYAQVAPPSSPRHTGLVGFYLTPPEAGHKVPLMTTATPPALHLVPKPCRYSQCTTGFEVNPKTWPGDLGYCSACCMSLAELDRTAAETVRHMNDLVSGLGF